MLNLRQIVFLYKGVFNDAMGPLLSGPLQFAEVLIVGFLNKVLK